ncbi:MAG: phosphate uptake regulator PhoU [Aigarchaeota archaeon]|nr:phosphate uptake regulator PhoU [Aigarchaeota archaeon]
MRSGGSLVISLPKNWVEAVGLGEGDYVEIRIAGSSIVISPRITEEPQSISIKHDGGMETTINKVIAGYLLGYDLIEVAVPRALKDDLERELLSVKDRLMGLEVVEEGEGRITLKVMMDPLEFKPMEILRRMWKLSDEMLEDSLNSIMSRDLKSSKLLEMREEDMDRLYFYMVRILRKSAINPALGAALELSSLELLDYRLAAYFLENIADRAHELMGFIDVAQGKLQANVKRIAEILLENNRHSMDAFLNNNLDALSPMKKNLEELTKLLTIPNLSYSQLRLRDIFLGIAEMQHDVANLIQLKLI